MKNVEETVKKYSGTLHTEVKDGKYITDIIVLDLSILNSIYLKFNLQIGKKQP